MANSQHGKRLIKGSCKDSIADWCYVYLPLPSQQLKCTVAQDVQDSQDQGDLIQTHGKIKSPVLPGIIITQPVLRGMMRVKRQIGVRGRDLRETEKYKLMLRRQNKHLLTHCHGQQNQCTRNKNLKK